MQPLEQHTSIPKSKMTGAEMDLPRRAVATGSE
jgi:hypothetical protein